MRKYVETCVSCDEPMTKYDAQQQQTAYFANMFSAQQANSQNQMLNTVPVCRQCIADGYSAQTPRKYATAIQNLRSQQ